MKTWTLALGLLMGCSGGGTGVVVTNDDDPLGNTDQDCPLITHTPIEDAQPYGEDVFITAGATDADSGVFIVSVYYREETGGTDWNDQALRAVLRATGLRERILYVPRPVGWNVGHVLETVFAAANAPRAPRLTRYIVAQLASEYTLSLEKAKNELGYAPTRTLFDFLASGAVERPRTRRTQSDSYAGNSTLRP